MKTSRSTLVAVALAIALTAVAARPAPAAAATDPKARLLTQIQAVRATLAQDATHVATAKTERDWAGVLHRRFAARLRADQIARTRLRAELDKGAAELYMLRASGSEQAAIIEQLRKLKEQIDRNKAQLAQAATRARNAAAALARSLRLYAVADARLTALTAQARKLQIDTTPPRRVQVRVTRSSRGWICPVAGPVHPLNDFGEPRGTGRHTGDDMLSDTGTPVVAVFTGKIVPVPQGYEGAGYGLLMILKDTAGHTWWYAHLSQKIAPVGTVVQPGQLIGRVGCTGRCTGSHLHFEFHPHGGAPADPWPFVSAAC